MWKWVAVVSLLYGILSVGAVLSWRQPPPMPRMPPPGRPDEHERPGGLGWFSELAGSAATPSSYDFEPPTPGITARPEATVSFDTSEESGQYLHWQPPAHEPFAACGMPLRKATDCEPVLRLRARVTAVVASASWLAGVRESDGSLYTAEITLAESWQDLDIPLAEMHLSRFSQDDNDRLDADQIDGAFIATVQPRPAGRGRRQTPLDIQPDANAISVDIDDFGFFPPATPAQ